MTKHVTIKEVTYSCEHPHKVYDCFVCLQAHIHTLEEQNGRLRDALVKAEADMVTADATANGRWSEWGDRATWVADKLDEAIEGVRAALAPPAPATTTEKL